MQEWIHALAMSTMGPDLKFTNEWGCEICGMSFLRMVESGVIETISRKTCQRNQVQYGLLDSPRRTKGCVLRTSPIFRFVLSQSESLNFRFITYVRQGPASAILSSRSKRL